MSNRRPTKQKPPMVHRNWTNKILTSADIERVVYQVQQDGTCSGVTILLTWSRSIRLRPDSEWMHWVIEEGTWQ